MFLCYFDKHARILSEVAFEQRHLGTYAAVFFNGDGQEGGQVLRFGKRCLMVGVLESHGERLLLVGGVGEPRLRFATKVVFGNLVLDDGLTLAGGAEAIADALVVGTHLQGEAISHLQFELVGCRLDVALAIEGGIGVVDDDRIASKTQWPVTANDGPIGQRESYWRRCHECHTVEAN